MRSIGPCFGISVQGIGRRELKGRFASSQGPFLNQLGMQEGATPGWEQPSGQFLITMSNKENEVVKFIGEEQRIKCEKIITLQKDTDERLINEYLAQLQRIQDYLQRLHALPSHLATYHSLDLYRKHAEDKLVLKIVTRFWEYPTLQAFLRAEAVQRDGQMERTARVLMHFLEEFMQVLLRAGGIDFFFYTPNNLFIIAPLPAERLQPLAKLVLNFTSLAGLKLLVGHRRIIREDFCEIFPLLPPNFLSLRGKQDGRLRLDSIIRKRALGWLTICFILQKVPELVDHKMLQPLVREDEIRDHLGRSRGLFQKVLSLERFKQSFAKAEKETGIKFLELFSLIFVQPYPKEAKENDNDFPFISWEEIYTRLFKQNKMAQQEQVKISESRQLLEKSMYFKGMLLAIWEKQPHKQYYLERDLAINPLGDQPQNMVYFLAKMNCNFHKLLKYHDVLHLIQNEHFSEDGTQVVVKLTKIFNGSGGQPEEGEKAKAREDDDEEASSQIKQERELDAQLYNPFLPKTRQQLKTIRQEISSDPMSNQQGFIDKLKRAPELLASVSSLHYFDSASGKNIVSVSQKQSILSEFCSSLWPL